MPRTGGVYSPPAGTKGVSGNTIQSVPYNAFVDDLTADANAARPITAGGTGATTASGARTALGAQTAHAALTSISGLTTSADKLPYTTAADTYAVTTLTAFGRSLIDDADATTARATLGLTIGTNVQAYDVGLASIAGLTTAADRMIYTTALDTYAVATLTTFARTLLDDADAATARATLGLTIGTNVQAFDTGLNAIAAMAVTNGNFIVGNGTTWVAESGATARASMGVPATTLTLTAGNGLTGGGDLSAARTFTLGTPSDITNSSTNSVTTTSHAHALGFIAAEVSTTTSANTTSFPLGHVVFCYTANTAARNGLIAPCLHASVNYQYLYDGHASASTALAGTWRSRGSDNEAWAVLQRVA
ncbi:MULTISPECIES: hypothetical protein [unclassified Sinorhizobium]|uniref:hypothetical protein n=1 Tax=unclassified Sinorhizobium TaxID=2613772 RepID=UPI0024C37999|nr:MULTISPECIES: hypothetical protein [unclassified Sinorhizobium]MDK1377087.1 hypothetical protein [Sinorhizobium sp. 6-70]MDK1479618.1 hypothetical protein [Sinorhizobium sp. 6-117]